MDNEELAARINAKDNEYGASIAALVKRSTDLAADLTSAIRAHNAVLEENKKIKAELEAIKTARK